MIIIIINFFIWFIQLFLVQNYLLLYNDNLKVYSFNLNSDPEVVSILKKGQNNQSYTKYGNGYSTQPRLCFDVIPLFANTSLLHTCTVILFQLDNVYDTPLANVLLITFSFPIPNKVHC